MSAELANDIDADVHACPRCQSPVFHDELYCEACGGKVSQDPEPAPGPSAPVATGREPPAPGSIAGMTDRGRRRQRNEDALAIAAAGDRLIATVCDGVASAANHHRADPAAAPPPSSTERWSGLLRRRNAPSSWSPTTSPTATTFRPRRRWSWAWWPRDVS